MGVRWLDAAPAALRDTSVVDLRDVAPPMLVVDSDGRLIAADEASEALLGSHELLGRTRDSLGLRFVSTTGADLSAGDDPVLRTFVAGAPQGAQLVGLETRTSNGGTSLAWVELTTSPMRVDGAVAAVAVWWQDVSQAPQGRAATAVLVRSLQALTRAAAADEVRFRALAENAADVVIQGDVGGRCVWVSPSVREVLGWDADELVGQSLLPLLHPDDRERANEQRRASLTVGVDAGLERLEQRYATKSGGWRWMSALSRPLRDATGRVVGGLTALRDIQDDVERREELRYLAGHDGLTGLVNREAAVHHLTRALATVRGTGRHVGVLYLDVDRFKDVNDTYGHAMGDRLLVEVGRRLTATLRDTDVVARLGGDEFLVVLTSVREQQHAAVRALALLDILSRPGDEGVPSATVSIGVVTDDGGGDPAAVLREADAALYRAKHQGRNTVSL